ncbi:hypothetical protein ACEPAI_8923 [Sanghuangporus weigelae]
MAKAGFYAVAKGRVPGIYASWEDCEIQVKGYTGARYKKFKMQREAEDFVSSHSSATVALVPSSSRSRLLPVPVPVSRTMGQSQKSDSSEKPKLDVSRKDDGIDEEGFDVVYADGACKGNGQVGSVAGVGVWWGHNDPRNIAERCPGAQTNNRAELIAIVRVLETTAFGRPLIIKTDSTYSIKCLQVWHQNWAQRNWKTSAGKPVLNAPLIKYLLSLLNLRQLHGFPVKFVYVKGHAGIEGNEGADAQANLGTVLPEAPERYWEDDTKSIEALIKEARESLAKEEGPEVVDKGVQVDIANDDDMPTENDVEPSMEAADDQTPAQKTSTSASTPSGSKDTVRAINGSATASAASQPPNVQKLNQDSSKSASTVEVGSNSTNAVNSEHQPEPRPQPKDNLTIINNDEFGLEDLLSPEELETELAEAQKG